MMGGMKIASGTRIPSLGRIGLGRLLAVALLAMAAVDSAAAQDQETASPPAKAGSGFDFGGGAPIEISADNGIEWNRDAKTYTARGNAVASQGNSEVHAESLVASYGTDSNQIDRLVAQGAVKIINPTQTAYGDRADYDRNRRLLVLTGSALKIVSASETVTARDAFEYWQDQDVTVAKGAVAIVKPDGTKIYGDQVTSYFRKNPASGKREAFQVQAEGHVKIDTGKEVATCSHLAYDPTTKIAVLTGNVVLTQNRNVFKGARAEIDTAKGISRLTPAPGERVRTVIQPKQKSNPAPSPATPPNAAAPSSSSSTGGAMASEAGAALPAVASP
jgi:lipopolysaccharide export system protein LptA